VQISSNATGTYTYSSIRQQLQGGNCELGVTKVKSTVSSNLTSQLQ